MLSRRSLIFGAPAIVACTSLMKVRVLSHEITFLPSLPSIRYYDPALLKILINADYDITVAEIIKMREQYAGIQSSLLSPQDPEGV